MKRIMQFRYRGTQTEVDTGAYIADHIENYPTISNYRDKLLFGNIFQNYGQVSQFGVQGPVGLRFYLNNSPYAIMIGETGIYELDLEGVGRITSIKFNKDDLDKFYPNNLEIDTKNDGQRADRLLIDIVYEGA